MESDNVKLPLFHGNGTEDIEQYQILHEIVQTIKQVVDEDIKRGQLAKNFRGRALDWYMKFMQVPMGKLMKNLAEIRNVLIEEFQKPKSELQYITELKEFKQYANKSIWDFGQRFKMLMAKVSFGMSDIQHKEWFITVLVPHIRMPLMQQKIATQSEALEIAMKLEASHVDETGVGMNQIQSQLAKLMI